MRRTEEQIAADDALTAAIERTARAYGVLGDADVMGDYVVLAATQELREDEVENSYINLVRNGSSSTIVAVGLCETAAFDLKMGRNDG
jgi:hypothetical protein